MNFIELYSTKEEALSTRYSPLVSIYNYRGIHLLPESDLPYVQVTENPNGVNIEDWEVFLVSVCGNERIDITTSFDIVDNIEDYFGNPQIVWKLTNLPDAGSGLYYIEANQILSPGNIDVVNGNIMRVNLQSTGQEIQLQAGDSLFFSMTPNLVQGHNGVIPPPYNYINVTT